MIIAFDAEFVRDVIDGVGQAGIVNEGDLEEGRRVGEKFVVGGVL